MDSFSLTRSLDVERVKSDAYVVFRSVATTLTDGSKVYDVVMRDVATGELVDVSFCQTELEALELAARLNSALLIDRHLNPSGYSLANRDAHDGCPG